MGQKHTLFFAAGEGRVDDLKWVLYQKKVSPNLRDHESQEVALHLAASRGHVECVKLLLKAGANVDARNNHGLTPLHLAVCDNRTRCVHALINGGADVNTTSRFGCTPLHQASYFGRLSCCKELLQAGALVDVQESWGRTPLFLAIEKSNIDIVMLLLQNNASVHITDKVQEQTPLVLASSLANSECMHILLDHNADPNYQDIYGHTPLHHVAHRKKPENLERCIRLLVAYGASSVLKNSQGKTPKDILLDRNRAASAQLLIDLTCKPRSLRNICWVLVRQTLQIQGSQNLRRLGVPRSIIKFIDNELAFLEPN